MSTAQRGGMVHYVKYLVVVSPPDEEYDPSTYDAPSSTNYQHHYWHRGRAEKACMVEEWLAHGPSFGEISTTHSTNIVTVETLNVLRRARMGLKRKEKRGELRWEFPRSFRSLKYMSSSNYLWN
jgi:hypothetical protein